MILQLQMDFNFKLIGKTKENTNKNNDDNKNKVN